MSSKVGLVLLWEIGWIGGFAGNSFSYERSQFQIGKRWNVPANTPVGVSGATALVSTKVPVWHSK
jgi:hypothetical protein